MVNFIPLADTTHNYSGNIGSGLQSIDNNFSTYLGHSGGDYANNSGGSFGGSATPTSTHNFAILRTIKQIIFKMSGNVHSESSTDHVATISYKVQYQLNNLPTWYDVAGGTYYSSGGNDQSVNSGTVVLTVDIPLVSAVQAYISSSGSYHNSDFNGDGYHNWNLYIYEIQAYGDAGGFASIM